MKTCPYCGANLDAGERCDCIDAKIDDGRVMVGADNTSKRKEVR